MQQNWKKQKENYKNEMKTDLAVKFDVSLN